MAMSFSPLASEPATCLWLSFGTDMAQLFLRPHRIGSIRYGFTGIADYSVILFQQPGQNRLQIRGLLPEKVGSPCLPKIYFPLPVKTTIILYFKKPAQFFECMSGVIHFLPF